MADYHSTGGAGQTKTTPAPPGQSHSAPAPAAVGLNQGRACGPAVQAPPSTGADIKGHLAFYAGRMTLSAAARRSAARNCRRTQIRNSPQLTTIETPGS